MIKLFFIEIKFIKPCNQIDLTDYSFLPNSLVSMLTYLSMSSTDDGYVPIFSYTKLFLVDLTPNSKVVFNHSTQAIYSTQAIG